MVHLESAHDAFTFTCTAGGRYLHSAYNPRREAQQFVSSLACDFNPFCLVVLGPCLSYCLPFLRKRFPAIPLYAIQYDECFLPDSSADFTNAMQTACEKSSWDGVFFCGNESGVLSETLFSVLGDRQVFGAFFIAWKPAEQVFENKSRLAWEAVKLLLQKSRDVLATQSFFSRRWLKNSVKFCAYLRRPCTIEAGNQPVLVAASGPSLAPSLQFIQKHRASFFLIAVSSALNVLVHSGIYPDMLITTDGGFYAQYHVRILKKLHDRGIDIPIAAPAESNMDPFLLENIPVLPLRYGDGIESLLFDFCGIKAARAVRNGSVSGTAAEFALSISSSPVFFCGLDLAPSKSFQHAQPNALEQNDSRFDNRLKPLSSRLYASSHSPLGIYRRWFSTQGKKFSGRVFRLSDKSYKEPLGSIRDILWTELDETLIENGKNAKKGAVRCLPQRDTDENKKAVFSFLTEQMERRASENLWYENCALIDYLSALKYPKNEKFMHKCRDSLLHTFDELFKLL